MVHHLLFKTVALTSGLLASFSATTTAELETVKLSHPSGSTAEVFLFGAHVKSFRTADEPSRDVIFMSDHSYFDGVNPIRGGIPVVFPNFGSAKGFPSHGFARITNWALAGVREATDVNGATTAKFTMAASNSTREMWPVEFELEYEVKIFANQLETALHVHNTFAEDIQFHALFHNYFCVDDVRNEGVTVHGLKGIEYFDQFEKVNKTEGREFISFDNQTANTYRNAPSPLTVNIKGVNASDHQLSVEKTGFIGSGTTQTTFETDAVVWNPWIERSKTMKDFGPQEYIKMVAVEPGRVSEKQSLAAGETYTLQQIITVNKA